MRGSDGRDVSLGIKFDINLDKVFLLSRIKFL